MALMRAVLGNTYLRDEIYSHLPPENLLSFMRTCKEFATGLEKVHTDFLGLLLSRLAERAGTSLETAREIHDRLMEQGCVYAGGLICQLAAGTRYEDSDVDVFSFEPKARDPSYPFKNGTRWDMWHPADGSLIDALIEIIDLDAEKNLRPETYACQAFKDLITQPVATSQDSRRFWHFIPMGTHIPQPATEVPPMRGYSTQQYVEGNSRADVLYFGPLVIQSTDTINEYWTTPEFPAYYKECLPARKVMDIVWLPREDSPKSLVSTALATFDMEFCKVAYDGRRLHFASFASTLQKTTNRYFQIPNSSGRKRAERIHKYRERGYNIDVGHDRETTEGDPDRRENAQDK